MRCPRKVSDRLTGRPCLFIIKFQLVQAVAGFLGLCGLQQLLGFAAAKADGIFIRFGLCLGTRAGFARLIEVDRLHLGPIMSSGRTTLSNVAASTKPRLIASSFRVVPFLCAVFATVVALS